MSKPPVLRVVLILRCRVLHGLAGKNYNEGREGGNPMLHQLIGKLVWHTAFIALLTALFTLPFIWMPSVWNYTVGGVEITKYIIVVIASIISFTCLTVTIKK